MRSSFIAQRATGADGGKRRSSAPQQSPTLRLVDRLRKDRTERVWEQILPPEDCRLICHRNHKQEIPIRDDLGLVI